MSREGKRECRAEESARRRPRPGGREKVREGGRGPLSFLPSLPQFSSPCSQATHRRHSSSPALPASAIHRSREYSTLVPSWCQICHTAISLPAGKFCHSCEQRAGTRPACRDSAAAAPAITGKGRFLRGLGLSHGTHAERLSAAGQKASKAPGYARRRMGLLACHSGLQGRLQESVTLLPVGLFRV